MEKDYIYFIGKNVASSKNTRQWVGKRLIMSKTAREYTKWADIPFRVNKPLWDYKIKGYEYPVKVGFYFYRDSKRRFDYINIVQIIADLMQKHGYIDDDDALHFIPVFEGFEVTKKEQSGFKMRILK